MRCNHLIMLQVRKLTWLVMQLGVGRIHAGALSMLSVLTLFQNNEISIMKVIFGYRF